MHEHGYSFHDLWGRNAHWVWSVRESGVRGGETPFVKWQGKTRLCWSSSVDVLYSSPGGAVVWGGSPFSSGC